MENLSYVGLSQQMALHRMMNVTANNIANMSTPGFKSQNTLFKEFLNGENNDTDKISQVGDYATYRNYTQGTLTNTSNPLDLAIQEDGFFGVKTPTGVRYTRNGSFSLNNAGEIVNKQGFQVLNESGTPIIIQPGATNISIAENGDVSTELGTLGKLKLVTFANLNNIEPMGNNLFDAKNAKEVIVDNPSIHQGMIENSNVQPILEMNKMIEISRMYQSTQQMLKSDHERLRGVIQKLTRV